MPAPGAYHAPVSDQSRITCSLCTPRFFNGRHLCESGQRRIQRFPGIPVHRCPTHRPRSQDRYRTPMIPAGARAGETREVSMVIQRRPHCLATQAVVPEPQVGSRTKSPGSAIRRRQRATIAAVGRNAFPRYPRQNARWHLRANAKTVCR